MKYCREAIGADQIIVAEIYESQSNKTDKNNTHSATTAEADTKSHERQRITLEHPLII